MCFTGNISNLRVLINIALSYAILIILHLYI